MNGEMIRRLRGAPSPEKGIDLMPFEEAYQNLSEARDALRMHPNLDFNYEKRDGKLPDEFSAFLGRTGPPPTPRKGNADADHVVPDDESDFDVTEEEGEEPPREGTSCL